MPFFSLLEDIVVQKLVLPRNSYYGRSHKKESVELTSVYLSEGCGKTCDNNKRYDTPHLDSMRVNTPKVYSRITIQGMSVIRRPVVIENFHIFT